MRFVRFRKESNVYNLSPSTFEYTTIFYFCNYLDFELKWCNHDLVPRRVRHSELEHASILCSSFARVGRIAAIPGDCKSPAHWASVVRVHSGAL